MDRRKAIVFSAFSMNYEDKLEKQRKFRKVSNKRRKTAIEHEEFNSLFVTIINFLERS
jgi:hypothetical protein